MIAIYDKYSEMGGVWSAVAHTARFFHSTSNYLISNRFIPPGSSTSAKGACHAHAKMSRPMEVELRDHIKAGTVSSEPIRVVLSFRALFPMTSSFGGISGSRSRRNLERFKSGRFCAFNIWLTSCPSCHPCGIDRQCDPARGSGEAEGCYARAIPSAHAHQCSEWRSFWFGHKDTFGGLLTIKSEDPDDDQRLNDVLENHI